MKLNKKKLYVILSQIKARQNIALLRDNPEYPDFLDIIFQPKSIDADFDYLNIITFSMKYKDSFFSDAPVEPLGKEFFINVSRLRDALKGGDAEAKFDNGIVNGIYVGVDADIPAVSGCSAAIQCALEKIQSGGICKLSIKFDMSKVDYELLSNILITFVSQDISRFPMNGFLIDLAQNENFINFAATDGKKLAICKLPNQHQKRQDNINKFILKPCLLFKPASSYSKTQWMLSDKSACIRIVTEDYAIDCWGTPIIDEQFPNYSSVVPIKENVKAWLTLDNQSAKEAFNSIKGLINNSYSPVKNIISLNAEDPKLVKISIPGASVDIDGEASRPMCLRFSWNVLQPTLFDTPYTKLWIQDTDKAVFAEENYAAKGTSLSILKIAMPIKKEDGSDEWGITAKAASAPKIITDQDGAYSDADDNSSFDNKTEVSFGESAYSDTNVL